MLAPVCNVAFLLSFFGGEELIELSLISYFLLKEKIPFHFLNLTSLSSLIIENNTPTVSPLRCSTFPLLSSSLQQVSSFEILSLPLTFHSPLLPSFAEID